MSYSNVFNFQVNYFGITDYILLGSTLLISLLIGLYFGYVSKQTNEELLMGGRQMSILPTAASILVTYVSAITVIGFPSEIYAYGGQIIMYHVVSSVGITISAFFLMPFLYEMKLTSVNEYLERRFQSRWIRWICSGIFISQQALLGGVYLYGPSIALKVFLGVPLWISIVCIGLCATVYTNVGGLKAVVWTDAFQFLIMIAGMLTIVLKGVTACGGMINAVYIAYQRGRMNFFDFTFDPFMRHNFWNFVIGTGFHSTMQPGIHQMQLQRYSGIPTCRKAKQAMICSVPLKVTMMSFALLTGFAIFAFYANCDPLTSGKIKKLDQIVPYFVVHELAEIPGMMGIFTSCIFSAVLSSLSSSLNSLAAVTWEDFLVRINCFRRMSPRGQTNVTRVTGCIYGVICMSLAFYAQNLGALYVATSAVIGATAGALYGVFIMGMFLPFVNAPGAITGGLTGFITMICISFIAFFHKTNQEMLSMSTEECPVTRQSSYNWDDYHNRNYGNGNSTMATSVSPQTRGISFDEFPWKIFTLSYLMYSIVAASITIIVGITVSVLVDMCLPHHGNKKPKDSNVHPAVRSIFRRFIITESRKDSVCETDSSETSNTNMNMNYTSTNQQNKSDLLMNDIVL